VSKSTNRGVAADPEHEIVEELAEEIEQNGERRTITDEETVKREGALNAEAVQSNRRRQAVLNKKRGGAGSVPWNESRAPLLYDDIIAHYPANTLMIYIERLSGTPASWYLYGQPKSGVELYQHVLRQCHGRREETEYRVVFRDAQRRFDRGIGRLIIPSTLDDPSVPAAPQGLAMQGAVPPVGAFPTTPHMPQTILPQQQYAPQFAQTGGFPGQVQENPSSALMEIQRQIAELSGRMTAIINGQATRDGYRAAPVQPATPPPGMFHVPGFGFVPMVKLMEAMGAAVPTPVVPTAPAQRQLSPAEQFRDSIGLITVAVDAAKSMQALIPAAAASMGAAADYAPAEEETPVRTIKMGDMNLIVNKADGSTRLVETAIANGDKILGWLEKQRQALQQQSPTAPVTAVPTTVPTDPVPMPQWPGTGHTQ